MKALSALYYIHYGAILFVRSRAFSVCSDKCMPGSFEHFAEMLLSAPIEQLRCGDSGRSRLQRDREAAEQAADDRGDQPRCRKAIMRRLPGEYPRMRGGIGRAQMGSILGDMMRPTDPICAAITIR